MNPKTLSRLVLSALLVLSQLSCDKEDPISQLPLKSSKPSHLSVFGFYTYSINETALLDQSRFANMVDVTAYFPDSSIKYAVDLIQLAKSKNMKVKLNLTPTMFRDGTPSTAELQSWQKMVDALRPYESTLGAFYSSDEPYWGAWLKAGDPWSLTPAQKLEASRRVKPELERMNAALKAAFPNVPRVYVEAWPVVMAQMDKSVPWEIPEGYDWIGTDCYEGTFEHCNGASIPAYYAAIKAKLRPGQKMILVPPSHIQFPRGSTEEPTQAQIDEMVDKIEKYRLFAMNEPLIVGMWPWMYTVGGKANYESGGTQYRGYYGLPAQIQEKFQSVGKFITGM